MFIVPALSTIVNSGFIVDCWLIIAYCSTHRIHAVILIHVSDVDSVTSVKY